MSRAAVYARRDSGQQYNAQPGKDERRKKQWSEPAMSSEETSGRLSFSPEDVPLPVPPLPTPTNKDGYVPINVANLVLRSITTVVVIVAVSVERDDICDKMWDVIGLTLTALFLFGSYDGEDALIDEGVRRIGAAIIALLLIAVDSLDLFNVAADCNAKALRVGTGALAAAVLLSTFVEAGGLLYWLMT